MPKSKKVGEVVEDGGEEEVISTTTTTATSSVLNGADGEVVVVKEKKKKSSKTAAEVPAEESAVKTTVVEEVGGSVGEVKSVVNTEASSDEVSVTKVAEEEPPSATVVTTSRKFEDASHFESELGAPKGVSGSYSISSSSKGGASVEVFAGLLDTERSSAVKKVLDTSNITSPGLRMLYDVSFESLSNLRCDFIIVQIIVFNR